MINVSWRSLTSALLCSQRRMWFIGTKREPRGHALVRRAYSVWFVHPKWWPSTADCGTTKPPPPEPTSGEALAVGARGAHLPGRGLPPSDARTLWGDGCLGVSVHDVEEAEQSGYGDADYLTVGTLFSTPSHPDRTGRGAGLIAEVGGVAGGRPLLGIGGVSVRRVSEVMEAGAHGVAVIGGVWGAGESTPEQVSRRVRDFLEALPDA